MRFGRTSLIPRSVFVKFKRVAGRVQWTISTEKEGLETAKKDSHTPKLVLSFMVLNSIGAGGDNLLVPSRKLIRANYGPFQSLRMLLNRLVMMAKPRTLIVHAAVLFLPMHWAVKTETSPTSVCGRTTPPNWPRSMV